MKNRTNRRKLTPRTDILYEYSHKIILIFVESGANGGEMSGWSLADTTVKI